MRNERLKCRRKALQVTILIGKLLQRHPGITGVHVQDIAKQRDTWRLWDRRGHCGINFAGIGRGVLKRLSKGIRPYKKHKGLTRWITVDCKRRREGRTIILLCRHIRPSSRRRPHQSYRELSDGLMLPAAWFYVYTTGRPMSPAYLPTPGILTTGPRWSTPERDSFCMRRSRSRSHIKCSAWHGQFRGQVSSLECPLCISAAGSTCKEKYFVTWEAVPLLSCQIECRYLVEENRYFC